MILSNFKDELRVLLTARNEDRFMTKEALEMQLRDFFMVIFDGESLEKTTEEIISQLDFEDLAEQINIGNRRTFEKPDFIKPQI